MVINYITRYALVLIWQKVIPDDVTSFLLKIEVSIILEWKMISIVFV